MASRNALSVGGPKIQWSDPSRVVPKLGALSDEALLIASKKRQRGWVASLPDDESASFLLDVLSLTPSAWNVPPDLSEFSVGSDLGVTDTELSELLGGSDWRRARQAKDEEAGRDESPENLWNRKFAHTARFCNELDFVDGYLVNHMRNGPCVLASLFAAFPEDFRGVVNLNFISPSDLERESPTRAWSIGALERHLVELSSAMSHTRGSLAVRVCRKSIPGPTRTEFPHDRWIHQRFDSEMGIYHSLGKGLDSFRLGNAERTILAAPNASGWSARKAQIKACIDSELTERLNITLGAQR